MPLFRVENAAASTGGVFLLPFPSVDWFSWAILGAVTEMADRRNWVADSTEEIDYAVRESNRMLAEFKVLNFNPFPIGLVLPFGGESAPDGYLLADGSSYDTADYPELFSVVGYSFGGSGSSFNVPNLLGRVPMGVASGYDIGSLGGEATHQLTESELASHSHTIGATITTPVLEPGEVGALTPIPLIDAFTGTTGGDIPHNNLQPYQVVNYVIYAGRFNA